MPPIGDTTHKPEVTDWLVLALRAYTEPRGKPGKSWTRNERPSPSDWVLIFDCETRTTPDLSLRFGAYQLRFRGRLWERGVFYDTAGLREGEFETLSDLMLLERPSSDGERIFLRSREAFVSEVFLKRGFAVGAQIVGFNLPFDLSRLAIRHVNARDSMKGGFSFVLSDDRRIPNVAVKHLSARAALIRFTGASTGRSRKSAERVITDRGYFVDVKTLAATLTGGSHSLAGLCKLLKAPTQKQAADEHGAPLTPVYLAYALDDVQATWECFDILARRVASFGLPGVGLYDLFSEASLGKAYLKAMGVKSWRELQPDFSREVQGWIMSAYFGGRAEVHIRRQIVEVVHCDFRSMYPTVSTLMGLWRFVISKGIDFVDVTAETRDRLSSITAADLQSKAGWRDLAVLVQISPEADILPVRACYGEGPSANIGLNHLSSDEPLWFTLADVIAAKVLNGSAPKILKATRFVPRDVQSGLRPIMVAGKSVDPEHADFYRELIDHRGVLQSKVSEGGPDAARFDAEQLAAKILTNSTAYGIFMELNPEDSSKPVQMMGYGAGAHPFAFTSRSVEKPGLMFHPLLGALTTGAARLMLALAERKVLDEGLDWAFCDTDSIAIANPSGMAREEFLPRAEAVQAWFSDLNPYAKPGSILKIEDVNYGAAREDGTLNLEPLFCLAISSKRYVLFNRDSDGRPIIRKASGHGLGHLMDPFDDPAEVRSSWIKRIGVPRWQAEVWMEIISAVDAGRPDVVPLGHLPGFNEPSRSRYAATTPELLSWFSEFNEGKPYSEQIKPFNFMLSLQLRSDMEIAPSHPDDLTDRGRARAPRPAAPFSLHPADAARTAFDRGTGKPVQPAMLKTLARNLVRYHLHPEAKFQNGDADAVGVLSRRHVRALAFRAIGKEAHDLEGRLTLGEDVQPDRTLPLGASDIGKLLAHAWKQQAALELSDRELSAAAGLSHHTLTKLRRLGGRTSDILKIVQAVETTRQARLAEKQASRLLVQNANRLVDHFGSVASLARDLGMTRQYVGRILRGERPASAEFAARVEQLMAITPLPSPPAGHRRASNGDEIGRPFAQ